ncbi:MAG TPA: glycoside hydrolase family 38 C-terminal domain-containing protein, partial [Anaerolineales bacterium]|nr:glycoside hydrolase family 38 C-terminal domain-containing protein [Anaerolineales bacterium]
DAWRTVCLNQFHDIIPGSSIGEVYEESQQQYADLTEDVTQIRGEALDALSGKLDGEVLLVNATSFAQRDLVFIPGDATARLTRDGATVPVQPAESGIWIDAGELAPYSVTALQVITGNEQQADVHRQQLHATQRQVSPMVLENSLLRVECNKDGDITRIFDKAANREVLPPGEIANQFQAFEDRPSDWDAWDIEIFYDDKMWPAGPASSIEMIEDGELRQTVEIKRRILNSHYTQRISLNHNSPRLDFDTHIEWNERHILLKVAFPVNVLAPHATYEIQWGNVQRPTHHNTSWDWARFETCAHKWVDLSEGNYGVSLLNDCKYGHDIHDNVIRLTLLRSPTRPDPTADYGEHQFKYSLHPHTGSWSEETQREAYLLNDPILVYRSRVEGSRPAERLSTLSSLLSASSPNVIIETIKRAEDGNGIIVRLYESQRKRGPVQLHAGFEVQTAWETNLLEENETELSVENNSIHLELNPYQIMTLRLKTG